MESQFYQDLLVADSWANSGKIVICDGLDADSNRDNFGNIHKLIPKCEHVVKLYAICVRCKSPAHFTRKLLTSDTIVDIGGIDKYVPLCRRCYLG